VLGVLPETARLVPRWDRRWDRLARTRGYSPGLDLGGHAVEPFGPPNSRGRRPVPKPDDKTGGKSVQPHLLLANHSPSSSRSASGWPRMRRLKTCSSLSPAARALFLFGVYDGLQAGRFPNWTMPSALRAWPALSVPPRLRPGRCRGRSQPSSTRLSLGGRGRRPPAESGSRRPRRYASTSGPFPPPCHWESSRVLPGIRWLAARLWDATAPSHGPARSADLRADF